MKIGTTIRGAGATRHDQAIRMQTERAIMGRLRNSGLLRSAETLNVTDQNNLDQLRFHLERQREHGAPRFQRQQDLEAMQLDFFHLAHIEPVVMHGIAFRAMLAMGGGILVTFADTAAGRAAENQFSKFDRTTKYLRQRLGRLVPESMLFGDELAVFIRQGSDESGPAVDMRILDPVTRNGGFGGPVFEQMNSGMPGLDDMIDIETVKGYKRRGGSMTPSDKDLIPPEAATHWRWRTVGNQQRGRPLMEPCYDELWQLRQSVRNSWILLEWLQRMMGFIIHVNDAKVGEAIKRSDIELGIPDFLSAYLVPFGCELEFPKPKDHLEFGDKWSRGPEYFPERRIAMTLGIPLHFIRMEFNEGNYASFLSAEGPIVTMGKNDAEWWEDLILDDFEKILPGSEPGIDYVVAVLPLVMRDRHKETEQLIEAKRERILSRQTVQERGFDLDVEVEESRLADEREDELSRMRGTNPNGGLEGDDAGNADDGNRDTQAVPREQPRWLPYNARARMVPEFRTTEG